MGKKKVEHVVFDGMRKIKKNYTFLPKRCEREKWDGSFDVILMCH